MHHDMEEVEIVEIRFKFLLGCVISLENFDKRVGCQKLPQTCDLFFVFTTSFDFILTKLVQRVVCIQHFNCAGSVLIYWS